MVYSDLISIGCGHTLFNVGFTCVNMVFNRTDKIGIVPFNFILFD